MKTKFKFISCILMLLIIATTGVWAKETPVSPTNEATAGLASTEADQFMSVLDWGKVKFDKVFVFMGFKQDTSNLVDLGAAFKAGPLFIGSWYQGNLGTFKGKNNNEVKTDIAEGTPPGTLGNVTHTTQVTGTDDDGAQKYDLKKEYLADHSAVMLFGFGNIGIRTGYLREGNNYSGKMFNPAPGSDWFQNDKIVTESTKPEYLASTVYSPKGYLNQATHRPFVDFGMNIPLGKMILSPTASLKVEIYQGSNKTATTYYGLKTVTEKDSKEKYKITTTQKAASDAHVGITGKLGAGLALDDSLKSVFGLGYEFTVNAYGKSYKAADGTKHKIKGNYLINTDKVEDDYNKGSLGQHIITKTFNADFIKKSYFSNTLRLKYKMQKDFTDRLSLLAGVEVPVTVTLEKSVKEKNYKEVTKTINLNNSSIYTNNVKTTTITYPIETVNALTLNVDPSINAAISYAAMPNRVFLNLGTKISFLNGSFKSTKTSYDSFVKTTKIVTEYDDGHTVKETYVKPVSATEKLNKESDQQYVKAELKGGLRWNIVENVAFDLVYGTSLLSTTIEWYKFQNLRLACTIKF